MDSARQNKLSIVIDDRERASGLAEALPGLTGCAVEVRRLAVGDVAIGERYLIERKAAADFVASVLDGRLERQLDDLTRAAPQPIVLIEGEFNAETLAGMAPQAIRQVMLAIQLEWRMPLIRSRDAADTARWIAALAEKALMNINPLALTFDPAARYTSAPSPVARSRPAHPTGHRSPRRLAPADPENVQLAALLHVPRVGLTKAKAILRHFGSIQTLLTASESELAAVTGIGPCLAGAIHSHFMPDRKP